MASLGEMAAGIAHEFNNPLAVIHAKAVQMKRKVEAGMMTTQEIGHHLDVIARTSLRISKTVHSLRTFAREGVTDPPIMASLGDIVTMTLDICQERLRAKNIVVETKNLQPETKLLCRDGQISQVLLNLLNNAYDAIQGKEEKWIEIASKETATHVLISVTDSGDGIPAAVAEKIMQPFFTTKSIGQGVGLGLSISRGIAEAHHGSLELNRQASHTSFVLSLPKVTLPA